ncbi:MAG: prepilin-type N-terminal cleavage/methylation domain-containing protein [Nitrospinales bacterium]
MFRDQERGYTLLELIISITIIAVIVGISLGGMRLGLSTREIGEQKAETYQRLRFIGEQISKNVKSLHPLFIRQQEEEKEAFFETEEKATPPKKVMAFEGLENSIRFITFADSLSMIKNPPWMHEVRFYLGRHPKSLEKGIIMMERDIVADAVFTEVQPDSPAARYIMLAQNVADLRFRYYKMEKLTSEELESQEDKTIKYKGEWVDTWIINADEEDEESPEAIFGKGEDPKTLGSKKKDEISLPRAIEIYVALNEPDVSEGIEEPDVVFLPPIIVPVHSGIELARPPEEEEEDQTEEKKEGQEGNEKA